MDQKEFSTLTHAGLIKNWRIEKKSAFGSRRDAFLLLIIFISANVSAIDYSYSFVAPTRSTSYELFDSGSNSYLHYLKLNLTHSMVNTSNCTLALTMPNNSQTNYSMESSANNCHLNISITQLGNYSFTVSVYDASNNSFQTSSNWTVGQWCDAELLTNLVLAGNLDANLLQTNYCLDLTAPNAVLDCNGYNISAISGSIDSAIRMGGANSSVRNCNFNGPAANAYILVSDVVGGNQSNFSIINNTFSSANSPSYGDVITDFGSTEIANYTLISGNRFSHSVIISGNMKNLDFLGNIFVSGSKVASGTINGALPNALLFEEQGNGIGSRDYWRIEGNSFNATGSDLGNGGGCASFEENRLGGTHATDFINNTCSTDESTVQLYHFGASGQGNLSIINSTFSPFDTSLWENSGTFTNVYWWAAVNVANSTSSLENASVEYYDSSGVLIGSGFTDSRGVASFLVLEFSHIDGSPVDIYKTPHMFRANLSGYNSTSANVTINATKTIPITLNLSILVAVQPQSTPAAVLIQSQSVSSSGGNVGEQEKIKPTPTVPVVFASPAPGNPPILAPSRKQDSNADQLATDVSESLFDIVVQVLEKNLETGRNPTAKISLTKFNKPGLLPVDLHYEIRKSSGEVIYVEDEKVTVEVNHDFLKTLTLPQGTKPGDFAFYAKVTYEGGKIAESSDAFKLADGPASLAGNLVSLDGQFLMPAIAIAALIAAVLLFRAP